MGLMSTLFGGAKSQGYNKAYDTLNSEFSPLLKYAGLGLGDAQSFLGGDASGFNRFKDATGFNWLAEQGSRGITGNAAARGLLRSGATSKALVDYGNNMNNQYANSYLDKLLAMSQGGLQAGNLLSDAGNFQKSKESKGIGGLVGGVLSMFSDKRLKKDIKKLKELKEGLNLYTFKYIDGSGPFIGVMADEVAKVYPEALGPEVEGFATVNYGVLNERLAAHA